LSRASNRHDGNHSVDIVNMHCYNCNNIVQNFLKGGRKLVNGQCMEFGKWLEGKRQKQDLSLRQVAAKTGLSHTTIAEILKGNCPSPETIKKLAQTFGASGDHHRMALEDELLILAGYRSERPEEKEFSEPMARLLDQISEFKVHQLKIMSRFADFISQKETE